MEKIRIGWEMASRWNDPTAVLIFGIIGWVATNLLFVPWLLLRSPILAMLFVVAEWYWWNFVYHKAERADTERFVEFHDDKLRAQYAQRRIPMTVLYEAFILGQVDLRGDVYEVLSKHRHEFVNYKVVFQQVVWLLAQSIPGASSSFKDKLSTKVEIAAHYDRGNDFFNAFLGETMVYTSAVFKGLHQSLEEAQRNKMSLLCDKLLLAKGERFLDIGCGWGTLARHAASQYGAKSTGVTLSAEGAKWCRDKNKEEGLEGRVEILQCDYRDIPHDRTFNKVASIEMAEHVGLKNFQLYLGTVRRLMTDDGLFVMQVAGLRQGSSWQDVCWGLFMSKYIFPGADASTPLNWYVRQMELAGFEVHSAEAVSRHYGETISRWLGNWKKNREAMVNKYGIRLCRLWDFFLAWSIIIAGQGSAACYQIVAHKNTYTFPRDLWCTPNGVGIGAPPQGDAATRNGVQTPTDAGASKRK